MRHRGFVASVAIIASASCAQAAYINDWNLIVRNDLNTSNHVDGSALVGGNLTGGSSVFAMHTVSAPNGDGLAVAGNITAGGVVQVNNSGNLRHGGSISSAFVLNGGAQISDAGISAMVTSAFNEANALSAYFAGLTPNGTLDGFGDMNASPASISGQQVAVYNINQSQIDSLSQLNLNFGAADTVIINYTAGPGGVANLISPPNIIGGFNQTNSARILWNFIDTTSLIIGNSFNGAILAPDADLQLISGGINGSVIVNSVSVQDAEIRLNLYTGLIPTPGAAAMGLLAAGMAAGRRRRMTAI